MIKSLPRFIGVLFLLLLFLNVKASTVWQSLGATKVENDLKIEQPVENSFVGQDKSLTYAKPKITPKTAPILNYIPNENNAFRLSMIKKDRQISQLLLANNDLKNKITALQRKVVKLSRQLQRTSKIALRKTAKSDLNKDFQAEISSLKTKIKRIRINDNVRCWKFKNLAEKSNIDAKIECKTL